MALLIRRFALVAVALAGLSLDSRTGAGQTAPAPAAKPTEHVLGTITAVNPAAHTFSVKDDKSAAEILVSTANTKTLIKVLPGAKDLKGATRIAAEDLAAGDRVDVRGFKDESNPNGIAARSVVLMSARELQAKHQADTAAWQNSTAGLVTSVNSASRTIVMTARATPSSQLNGPQAISVQVPDSAEITRYSPDTPKTPVPSQLAEIQPGDQVRVIGSKSADGSTVTAERVYSGAFRTIAGTITALSPDGKGLTLSDVQTKQPVQIAINDASGIHKVPPEMTAMLVGRMNAAGQGGGSPGAGAPTAGTTPASPSSPDAHPHSRGDLSQLVQHLPPISLTDLKPGDAVVVSGVLGSDKLQVIATTIIAGVEPLLQSSAGRARQGQGGQGLGGWSLDMAVPSQ